MDGYAYHFKWFDQDNTADFPTVIEGSESPADGASVTAGSSGQLLQVEVGNATGCTLHYGVDNAASASSKEGTVNGDYCKATVSYGADMTDNGTNYWYVIATNTAGTTRYPDDPATLSFTVSTAPDKKPIITPILMLLLKGQNNSTSTSGKVMPWLMLLL
jgi:hypothetical protein